LPKSRLVRGEVPAVRPDFRREYLDFKRGIRMGNLEPNQRITRILRQILESRHPTKFITDRWGRGVYWKWICWVAVESRKAKPISSGYNFGCAKFYITINHERETFEAGMQVERAPVRAGRGHARVEKDWDFHALVRGLRRGAPLAREIARLVRREGFTVRCGAFIDRAAFTAKTYRGPGPLARACRAIPDQAWGGFQLCYVFQRREIEAMSGDEIVGAVAAIFDELTAAMNAVMTVACLTPPAERPAEPSSS
jgi:hypothetical protein